MWYMCVPCHCTVLVDLCVRGYSPSMPSSVHYTQRIGQMLCCIRLEIQTPAGVFCILLVCTGAQSNVRCATVKIPCRAIQCSTVQYSVAG